MNILVFNIEAAEVNHSKYVSPNKCQLSGIDTPARKYLSSSDACELLNAGAIYTDNEFLILLGNAFILIGVRVPQFHLKCFAIRRKLSGGWS